MQTLPNVFRVLLGLIAPSFAVFCEAVSRLFLRVATVFAILGNPPIGER